MGLLNCGYRRRGSAALPLSLDGYASRRSHASDATYRGATSLVCDGWSGGHHRKTHVGSTNDEPESFHAPVAGPFDRTRSLAHALYRVSGIANHGKRT